MIDLHCHVLPGIDDGPETMAGSLALARATVAAGVSTLVATPHVSWRYPNRAGTIAALAQELRQRLAEDGVALELLPGAEVAMIQLTEIEPAELLRLRLGSSEWLLVEPPFSPVAGAIEDILRRVQHQGHRILLAHPERCAAFHRNPRTLGSLVRHGVLISVTAGSLVGRFGAVPQRFALELVHEQMVHNVVSDAHDVSGRRPGMAAELERAGLTPLTDWLTQAVPEAMLNGWEIPARPQLARLRAGPWRRWRLRR